MKQILKNKKADMTVLLLVILVLVVSSGTLFSFLSNSGKVEAKIYDVSFIEKVYAEKDLAEFYLIETGELAFVKIYKEFVEEDKYVENPQKENSRNQVRFGTLNPNLNEEFKESFIEAFKVEFEKYDFEELYLNTIKEIIATENFEIEFDGEVLSMLITSSKFSNILNDGKGDLITSLELGEPLNDMEVDYSPVIFLKFDVGKIGLHSFEEFYTVKENCKGEENVEVCFEELNNFNVEISENGDDVFVDFVSKKDFLIEGDFQNINFGFVLK
jgi:hypothetical protein